MKNKDTRINVDRKKKIIREGRGEKFTMLKKLGNNLERSD